MQCRGIMRLNIRRRAVLSISTLRRDNDCLTIKLRTTVREYRRASVIRIFERFTDLTIRGEIPAERVLDLLSQKRPYLCITVL